MIISSWKGLVVVSISYFYSIVSTRGSKVLISLYTIVTIVYIVDIFRRVIEPLVAGVIPSDSWLLNNILR